MSINLLTLVSHNSSQSPHTIIRQYLQPLPEIEQLDHLLNLFQSTHENLQHISETVVAAWAYVLEKQLWTTRYPSLESLQQAIHFTDTIKPILNANKIFNSRMSSAFSTIYINWKMLPHDAIPVAIRPSTISQHLARELARLSQICSLEEAMNLIQKQIMVRTTVPGRWSSPTVQSLDVLKVYENKSALLNPSSNQLTSLSSFDVVIPLPTNTQLSSTLTSESMQLNTGYIINDSETEESEDSSIQQYQRRRCKCSSQFKTRLNKIKSHTPLIERHRFLSDTCHSGVTNLCWDHLRLFCRQTAGLYSNSITLPILQSRINDVYKNLHIHNSFVHQHRNWFNKSTRDTVATDSLIPYRYLSTPMPQPTINPEVIFKHFGGTATFTEWLDTGVILLPDLCSYLNDIPQQLIDFEFNLYRHHFAESPGQPAKGFLRNMFYSGIQQLIRQDPGWYAMQVACRPDHEWRLICYPYVAKDPEIGENTGFCHMDINIEKYLEAGIGFSQLTSSISLDQEFEDGCTIVVPGFYKRIKEWQQRRKDRGIRPAGTTTDASSSSYNEQDIAIFGSPKPYPCSKYGIRLTLPSNIHGSTKLTLQRRRVLYSWHTRVAANGHDLEIPGQHSVEELCRCHRDLEAPTRGVAGELVTHSRPPFRFPAAISMESSSALGDALIGRRKWDDPMVIYEANLVLGTDDNAALQYVHETRQKLVHNYIRCVENMRQIEPMVFPNNSFVLQSS